MTRVAAEGEHAVTDVTKQSGGHLSRVQRVERIAPPSRRPAHPEVCWGNPGGAYNCDAVAEIEIGELLVPIPWEDLLDLVRERGRADLEPDVESVVARGKRALGLPRSHRHRDGAGPPPLRPDRAPTEIPSPGPDGDEAEATEMLEALLASRTRRMTAPLRRAGARDACEPGSPGAAGLPARASSGRR